MIERFAADLIVILHFAFIVFVGLGALLSLRWPRAAWLQVPAAAWGAAIEFRQGVCPLTPLEQRLRLAAGIGGAEAAHHYPRDYTQWIVQGAGKRGHAVWPQGVVGLPPAG